MPDYMCPECGSVGPNGADAPRLVFVCTHCGAVRARAEEVPPLGRVYPRRVPRGK